MNIAIIVKNFPGLSETFILDQITGLIDLGHHVEIFALNEPDKENLHQEVGKYKLLEKTHFFRIPKSILKKLFKACAIIVKYLFKQPSVILRCCNISRHWRKISNLSIFLHVEPFLDRKFDVIHCHYGIIGYEFLFLKDILKKSYMTSFHGYDVSAILKRHPNLYDELFQKADVLISNSDFMKNRLIQYGCLAQKIEVVRYGINLKDIRPNLENKSIPNGTIKILSIARFVEKKGLHFSIPAISNLYKRYPNIEYSIIGDGVMRKDLEELIDRLDANDYIKLLGWQERQNVKKYLAQSDIYVLASVTAQDGDMEGVPVSILEALAFEKPVVATRHSGIPEAVVDGQSGFLVPERDVDALSEKIERYITSPQQMHENGACGRKFIEDHYNISRSIQQLDNLYKKVEQYE